MARKTFVIDTNVFLHDPYAMDKFQDNDVVVPIVVLEEISSLKRQAGELGNNARTFMRIIDSLKEKGDFSTGIPLPGGTKVTIFLEPKSEKTEDFPLPLYRNTNKILLIAYLLRKTNDQVVFISKDFISRVKAEALGIEAEDYENLKVSYDNLPKGIRKFLLSKKEIDQFYKDGKMDLLEEKFFSNEYCLLQSRERSSALARYNHKDKQLEMLMHTDKGIWGISPLNAEQTCVIDLLLRDDIPLVALLGPAGTGKTLLALACGLRKVFDEEVYAKILVSRPIIPLGKDIGYLPGTKEEKLYHWMQPIYDNLEFLFQSSSGKEHGKSALDYIIQSKKVEMEAVTYIRGRSLPMIYFIIDEAQNLTPHETKTIISRAGKGAKVIMTGDPTQIDNPYLDKDSNGLSYVLSKFKGEKLFGHVFLDKTERSELAALAAKIM